MTSSPIDDSQPSTPNPSHPFATNIDSARNVDPSSPRLVYFGPPTAPPLGEPLDPSNGSGFEREPTWFDKTWAAGTQWFQRNSPAKEPSRWLAGVGALLLLVAGLALTIAKWQAITPSVRLGGLVLLHGFVVMMAERLRTKLPDVARALAHLGAGLFAATGIQAVSTLGRAMGYSPISGRWPLCCLVGGIAASLALELQRRRWNSDWMRAEFVVAVALAGSGLSAVAHVPVAIVAAIAGATAFATRRNSESIAFAMAAMGAPFIGDVVREWGAGTSTVLGITGNALGWAAPIAGGIAAATLWLAAGELRKGDRSRGATLRAIAPVGLALNVLVGFANSDIRLGATAWTWIAWGVILAIGLYFKNTAIGALSGAGVAIPIAVQLGDAHATRATFATVFACLTVIGIGVLIVGRRSPVVGTVSLAGACGSALALGFVADSFDAPVDLRILGLSMMLAGVALGLRGLFAARRNFELLGAGIAGIGLVAELLSFPTDHAFDIWLPLGVLLSAAAEWFLRSKGHVATRFAFATSATIASFYAVVGQLTLNTGGRTVLGVTIALVLLSTGALRKLNAVAIIGVTTLIALLGLAVGPRLATMPLWGQCALGGLVLFGLAAVLEKRRMTMRPSADTETGVSPR